MDGHASNAFCCFAELCGSRFCGEKKSQEAQYSRGLVVNDGKIGLQSAGCSFAPQRRGFLSLQQKRIFSVINTK